MPKKRSWSITILAILLFLEAIPLLTAGLIQLYVVYLFFENQLPQFWIASITMSIFFIPLGCLAIIASVGFIKLWANAWINAMFVQGMIILSLLTAHLREEMGLIDYSMLAFAIFIVAYLNYNEVHAPFLPSYHLEDQSHEDLESPKVYDGEIA